MNDVASSPEAVIEKAKQELGKVPVDSNAPNISSKPSGLKGMNIGQAEAKTGNAKNIQLPQNTLSGMYQSSSGGRSGFLSGMDFNFKSILNYIAVIINSIVIIALIFLVILPQYNLYVEHQTTIVEAREQFEKVDAHYTYLKNLEILQDDLYKNIDLAKQAIPEEEDVPQFLNQIAVMAKESEVDLSKNDFSGSSRPTATKNDNVDTENAKSAEASTINVRVTITGAYDNLKDFLARLEESRRLVSIADMKLSENKDDEKITPLGIENPESEAIIPIDENAKISKIYNLEVTLSGYYMDDPSIANLSVEQLVAKRELPQIVSEIESMKYYELTDILELEFGRENPFELLPNGQAAPIEDNTLQTGDQNPESNNNQNNGEINGFSDQPL